MFGSRTLSLFALGLSAFAGFAQASPIAAATLTAGAPIITTKATTADLSIPIFTKFGSNVAAISSRIALLDKQGLDLNDAFKSLFLEYDSAEAQLATLPVDSSKVRSAAHEQLIQTLTKAQLTVDQTIKQLTLLPTTYPLVDALHDRKDKLFKRIRGHLILVIGPFTVEISW